MRNQIVAGNWKMNKTLSEGKQLMHEILAGLPALNEHHHVIFGTPYIHLVEAVTAVSGKTNVTIAAQNCHTEESGAYTGEISAAMIKSTGAHAVILGHSERRQYFNETDASVAKKIDICLKYNLQPIVCVGEMLAIREAGTHFDLIKSQIEGGLFHLDVEAFKKCVIAYEPVWAIGTGKTATDEQAQEVHAFIRGLVQNKYGQAVANETSILYGGSCNPANAVGLFTQPDVDGGLIGGASLKAPDFLAVISAMHHG